MRLASKLKKKSVSKSDRDASKPTSGLALWEAKLAEQQAAGASGAVTPPAGSPAASPSRATLNSGRRMTITHEGSAAPEGDVDTAKQGAGVKPLRSSAIADGSGRRLFASSDGDSSDGDDLTSSGHSSDSAMTYDEDDSLQDSGGSTPVGPNSPLRSPRKKQPLSKSDSTPSSAGLLGRLGGKGKSNNDQAKKKKKMQSVAAEEDARRRAQMAAIEIFKEKGSTCSYTGTLNDSLIHSRARAQLTGLISVF